MSGKPLEILDKALHKEILLRLRGNRELRGILRSYDTHLNLYLENVEMKTDKGEDGVLTENLGRIVLRGDNVVMVSPPER